MTNPNFENGTSNPDDIIYDYLKQVKVKLRPVIPFDKNTTASY